MLWNHNNTIYPNLLPLLYVVVCSADNFNNITLQHHLEVMKEMIGRDKNHPGIVMWSLANEPNSALSVSEPYFKYVFLTIDSSGTSNHIWCSLFVPGLCLTTRDSLILHALRHSLVIIIIMMIWW